MRPALTLAALLCAAPLFAQDPKAPAPRRLLFVQVAANPHLNPLTHAAPNGPDRTRDAAAALAAGLNVPTAKGNDQLFVLADALTDSPLPTRAAVLKSLDGYAAGTRKQDRVVLYLAAHLIEMDGKAYLVPADGDPDEPGTLIEVSDVYQKVGKIEAAQKVVIWDVGRFNPDRVRGRRDPGPLSEAAFKALTGPPDGVQALIGCSAGERGLEYFAPRGPAGTFAGSAYLDALRQAAADTKSGPGDPIPVAELHAAARKTVTGLSSASGLKQTPTLAGSAPKVAPPFDPKEKPADRFDWPEPPKGPPAADLKAVFAELSLPPVSDDEGDLVRLPFGPDALAGYAADVSVEEVRKSPEKYPLRNATLGALDKVRAVWGQKADPHRAFSPLPGPATDQAKRDISRAQDVIAVATAELELQLDVLETFREQRAREPKRWQAHYDLTVAELQLRLVLLHELNRKLAGVRTESLPDLPAGSPGYRLVPSDKFSSGREVKEQYAAARKGFEGVAAAHKGTPWAVLAKRSLAVTPGLRWEALPPKAAGK